MDCAQVYTEYAETFLRALYADHGIRWPGMRWHPGFACNARRVRITLGRQAVARMAQDGYREYTRLERLYQRGAFGTEAVHNLCLHEFAHVWLYCLQQLGAVSTPEHDLRCHGCAYRGLLAQLISDYPYRQREPLAAPAPVPEAVRA